MPRPPGRSPSRSLALAYLGVRTADEVQLEHVVDTHIARVFDATDGNVSLAAELLGMHRRSLQRYVRRKEKRRQKATTKARPKKTRKAGPKKKAARKPKRR